MLRRVGVFGQCCEWYLRRGSGSAGCGGRNGKKTRVRIGGMGGTLVRLRNSGRGLEGVEGILRMHGAQ